MIKTIIFLIFFNFLPYNNTLVLEEQHDICEINSVYDNKWHRTFIQVMWRDFNSKTKNLEIVAFRMVQKQYSPQEIRQHLVTRDKFEFENQGILWNPKIKFNALFPKTQRHKTHKYYSFFWDEKHDVFRKISVKGFVYTHTNYDVETLERDILPKAKRIGFLKQFKELPLQIDFICYK